MRLVDERLLACEQCGHRDGYSVPVVLDWRDYEAVALLAACCPTVRCSGCAEPVVLDTPILVLRPGDPISWLLSLPANTSAERGAVAAQELVQAVRDLAGCVPADPAVRIHHAELVDVATQYSGFALSSISYDGESVRPSKTDDWLAAVRSQVVVPDVRGALFDLLEAADSKDVLRVHEAHPSLLDSAWAPVFATLSQRVLRLLETPEASRLAKYRLVELNRRRWPHDPVPAESLDELDVASRAVLSRARDPALTTAERQVVLDQMIQLAEDLPEWRPLLTEALLAFFVQVYESPDRVPEDLEVVVSAGRVAVPLTRKVFGPGHPMTLIAMNDFAAALLDRQQGDAQADREQAIELLTAAATAAAAAKDRVLADILQNLGAAYAHRQRGGRADNQRRAEGFCAWSLHVARALTPERPRSIVLCRLALAVALRERRSGDRRAATVEALTIYQDILQDLQQVGLLRPAEQVLVQSNRVSALYQLQQLEPRSVDGATVVTAAVAVAASAENLPIHDPIRVASLSNMASVMGALYQENGFDEPLLLTDAVELTGRAYAEVRASYGHDHPETLRVGLNHAAMLGMPVREDSDSASQLSRVRHFDAHGAEELLSELLAVCPLDQLPAHTSVIANNLGRHYCGVGQWATACEAFRRAMAAMDLLYRDASDPEAQLAELGVSAELSWSSLAGWLVSASLQAGDLGNAVAAIEQSRGKLLADRLRITTPEPIRGPAEDDGPVLYVGVSALHSWVILVPPRGRSRYFVSTLAASDLRPAVLALHRAPDLTERSRALAAVAALLRENVTGPAYDLLVEYSISDVGVVASGLLSGVPLHVLPTSENDGSWLDLATVRYLPSVAIARHIERLPPSQRSQVVAVADPELALARHEAPLLDRALGPVVVAPEAGDRRRWLLAILPDAAHLLLSCHARWLEDDPLRSPIELDAHHVLLLADLLSLGAAPDLVVASCCDTGVTTEPLADEIVGFGTGMLLAGARATVVSNWELGDRISALTLAVFYQEIANGVDAAAALRVAQLWLAGLAVGDLIALGEGRPARGRHLTLPRGLARELEALRFTSLMDDPTVRPYADPACWGGFSYYGARVRQGKDPVSGSA